MFRIIYIVLLGLIVSFFVESSPVNAAPITITLDDVVKRIGSQNFEVGVAAKRLQQAKVRVNIARNTLLPKLNAWRLLSVPFDPTSVIGIVGDVVPFLDPTKWARLEQANLLSLAKGEGFRAIWSNALFTAKALYVHLLLDQSFLEHIDENQKQLKGLLTVVRNRELLGGEPKEASDEIEGRLLDLEEDRRKLEVLIAEEENSLTYMLGYPAKTQVVLSSVDLPKIEELEKLDDEDFSFRALDSSPELREMDYFISATNIIEQEIKYSFLGMSDNSRGILGGVFDNIPVIDGLSFGTPSSLEFLSLEKEILALQREGTSEVLKRQIKMLVANYNLDLKSYGGLKRNVELKHSIKTRLYQRLRFGENVESMKLIEASRNHIQADLSLFAAEYRFITNEDKLSRLIFYGDYSKQPSIIDELRRKKL